MMEGREGVSPAFWRPSKEGAGERIEEGGRGREERVAHIRSILRYGTGVEASLAGGRAHRAAITKARVPAQRKTKIDERIARNAPGKLQQRH